MLVAGSIQVTSNRFQEAVGSVLASGFTIGALNITGHKISHPLPVCDRHIAASAPHQEPVADRI